MARCCPAGAVPPAESATTAHDSARPLRIRSVQRDRRGEPVDPVNATADGVVAYVNSRSGLSNYGNYVVLRHSIEGLEVYSLYAHLSVVRSGL